ncbi:hypothetical protein IC582_004676 [Cucumis melo]
MLLPLLKLHTPGILAWTHLTYFEFLLLFGGQFNIICLVIEPHQVAYYMPGN